MDVRSPAEYETAHIAGSLNVPLDLVRERTRDKAERVGDDAVLVCRTGQRAERARRLLAGAGTGGGLTFAALSDTCAMASALSRLPYDRGAGYDPDALGTALSAS